MQIIIDLDGTICTEKNFKNRKDSVILKDARTVINKLYKKKHKITIYSARGWNELNSTKIWLKKNKIKYHQLILGKPIGDVWIDDRAIKFNNWSSVRKKLEKMSKKSLK